ncbi:MAG: hypothetical protein KBD07_05805 [Candidatus Omnitrophica bacterium]|jgi:hypothetical protein|nr:hypothetical protein [Candidatus Omnitrophota bacterium]
MKPRYLGITQQRLLMACGFSLLLHTAVIGGWAWFESGGISQISQHETADREISVRIVTRKPDAVERAPDDSPVPNPPAVVQSGPASSHAGLAENETAVSAQRVLDDPSTGLVFSAYFKAIRSKLVRRASKESVAMSSLKELPVHFVLARNGRVEGVWAPKGTPVEAQRFAERLLAAAGPFPPFPSTIRHPSIAFDVLFRFDENVLG